MHRLLVLFSRLAQFAAVGIACISLPAVAATDYSGEYLCQDQFAAGMAFSGVTNKWQSTVFAPPGLKFMLRLYGSPLPPNSMGDTFYLEEILSPDGRQPRTCTGTADRGAVEVFPGVAQQVVMCTDYIATYWLNLDVLRFAEVIPFGYLNGDDHVGGNFPTMLNGTCQKLPATLQ